MQAAKTSGSVNSAKKEKEGAAAAAPVTPHPVWTEAEHNSIVGFMNTTAEHATFNGVKMQDMFNITKQYVEASKAAGKIHSYILDFEKSHIGGVKK